MLVPLTLRKWRVDGRVLSFEQLRDKLAAYAERLGRKKFREIVVEHIDIAGARPSSRAKKPPAVSGLNANVAQVGHLIAMKLISRDDKLRPQDQQDLRQLSQVADEQEWARAGEAVKLITERGFDRGRDLRAALSEWRAQA